MRIISPSSDGSILGGSNTHVVIENLVNNQHVVSEYEADHIVQQVKKDQAYILFNQSTNAIRGVKKVSLLSVVIDLEDATYLFSVMATTTGNRNQPGVAAEILAKIYRTGSINIYRNAGIMNGAHLTQESMP